MHAASAEATREAGIRRAAQFVAAAGSRYAKSRNFDFGPERRGNVSMLSPYLRHRLVLEQEVLELVLARHSLNAAGKFVQEVFWRAYFKGWLEHRPDVWDAYRRDVSRLLQSLDEDSNRLERYRDAVEGRTGIDCFDAWAAELVSTGYLHNHARMWFASIWVYTLELPWQLGADFFYRHLVDGDPASNTLSWRWVCGLHTSGKTYLARPSNIARFTDNRFARNERLATSAPPLTEPHVHPIRPLPRAQLLEPQRRFGLLITEEDGHPESLLGDEAPVTVLGAVATRARSPLDIGEPARAFAAGAVGDSIARAARLFDVTGQLSDESDWQTLLVEWAGQHQLDAIVTPYVPVGPVADLLAAARPKLESRGVRLLQLRRPYDSTAWPHARGGFFKLRKKIPSILEQLGVATSERRVDSKAG
jgi:deoxyribodipyrimidine photo-lyase